MNRVTHLVVALAVLVAALIVPGQAATAAPPAVQAVSAAPVPACQTYLPESRAQWDCQNLFPGKLQFCAHNQSTTGGIGLILGSNSISSYQLVLGPGAVYCHPYYDSYSLRGVHMSPGYCVGYAAFFKDSRYAWDLFYLQSFWGQWNGGSDANRSGGRLTTSSKDWHFDVYPCAPARDQGPF